MAPNNQVFYREILKFGGLFVLLYIAWRFIFRSEKEENE